MNDNFLPNLKTINILATNLCYIHYNLYAIYQDMDHQEVSHIPTATPITIIKIKPDIIAAIKNRNSNFNIEIDC